MTEWEDCGNPTVLLQTNRYLLDRAGGQDERRGSAMILAPSAVAEDAVLERSIVGPYASIGAGVTVRDSVVRDTIAEAGATIEAAVVENSLVGRRARLTGTVQEVNIGDLAEVSG